MIVLARQCIIFLLMGVFGSGIIMSVARAETPAGQMISFKGQVHLRTPTVDRWRPPLAGESLFPKTVVRTGETGWAAILMADESLIQLSKNTRFQLTQAPPTAGWHPSREVVPTAAGSTRESVYKMDAGKLWIRNKKKNLSIDIHTPTVSAAIRGTELVVDIMRDHTVLINVLEGRVRAWNTNGELQAIAGEVIETRPGMAPTKRILLSPEDAVQWTLVIPPVGDEIKLSVPPDHPRYPLQQALADFEAKNFAAAIRRLDQYCSQHPQDSMAWRYTALAALVKNNPAKALDAAKMAVRSSTGDPADHVVLAYAHQAVFDLEQALVAVDKALEMNPRNDIALLIKARLLFGMDRTADAEAVLTTAASFYPNEAEIQNLSGFIALAEGKTEMAKAAFAAASARSPDLGEPHLGMALAAMRQSDEASAMEQISTAVLLEPQRSLFLSYWAKMLYQLKRFDRSLELLDYAERLDPRDPTPLLYKALIYRDLNQPTKAISALNAAMAKNDNRAVYRSRFLLDRDAAVKNVNLSLVYSQLGLPEWAKNKALASVKQDYTNASGHIFLAGALLGQEGRSRAGASENALGMLVQPANVNALNSFNEYTSFFEKPDAEGALTGTLGNHDTWGGSGFVSAAVPRYKTAFSVLGSLFDTDGWRGTDNYDAEGINGRIKIDPTADDGVLFSTSRTQIDTMGNIFSEPNEIDAPPRTDDRWASTTRRYTLGYHRRLSPDVTAMAYAQRRVGDYDNISMSDQLIDSVIRLDIDNRAVIHRVEDQLQGMMVFQKQRHQIIAGGLCYWRNDDRGVTDTYRYSIWDGSGWLPLDEFTETFTAGGEQTDRFISLHLEDIWRLHPGFTIEGALYWERIERLNASDWNRWTDTEVLPRLGIIWTPGDADTIRIAAFRYLVPYAFERIDPQDIAGITISRNTYEGALSEEADIMWEHEWRSGLFSMNLFYLESTDTWEYMDGSRRDWNTRIAGMENAWNQMLFNGFGMRVTYRYLDVDDDFFPEKKRYDHLAAVALTYVSSRGFRFSVTQGYRYEDFDQSERENESIWLTDASGGIELPGKRGDISLTVNNIFDQRFNWVQDPFVLEGRAPAREVLASLSVFF
jgi:tetratricopeptide (TPR) repeat protein